VGISPKRIKPRVPVLTNRPGQTRCEQAKQKGGQTMAEDILTITADDSDITTMEPVYAC